MRIAGLTSISLFLHAALLFSLDHSLPTLQQKILFEQKQIVQKKDDQLQFQFVESPRQKLIPHKPRPSHKISDQDALNQDLSKNKKAQDDLPLIKAPGRADQLAQRHRAGSRLVPKNVGTRSNENVISSSSKRAERARREVTERSPDTSRNMNSQDGLSGQDKIITQEVARLKSGAARLTGMVSFEATGSGMGVYMKNLKEKIWLAWFPYLAVHYPKDFKTADAIVGFKLNAKGEVKIVELVENKGSPLFAAICMESVQRAGSFGPVPQEILDLLGKDELEIKFAFHYW